MAHGEVQWVEWWAKSFHKAVTGDDFAHQKHLSGKMGSFEVAGNWRSWMVPSCPIDWITWWLVGKYMTRNEGWQIRQQHIWHNVTWCWHVSARTIGGKWIVIFLTGCPSNRLVQILNHLRCMQQLVEHITSEITAMNLGIGWYWYLVDILQMKGMVPSGNETWQRNSWKTRLVDGIDPKSPMNKRSGCDKSPVFITVNREQNGPWLPERC